jgi:hypothetical protein
MWTADWSGDEHALDTIEPGQIFIAAVMHLSREPGYWRHRVSP